MTEMIRTPKELCSLDDGDPAKALRMYSEKHPELA